MIYRCSRKIVMSLLVFSLLFFTGCQKQEPSSLQEEDYTVQNTELKELLPEKTGFRWIYNGFAEYGHMVELMAITTDDKRTIYQVEGKVDDPSGGEAPGDFTLNLEYIIKDGTLVQKKQGPKMMDSFNEIVLIKAPLQSGTNWKQSLKDQDGREYQLVCTITGVKEDNRGKSYTVLYEDANSDFYEKRVIQEKLGVVSFEKLWKNSGEAITMGYELYREASGYPVQTALLSYLPPLDKPLRYYGLAEYAHEGTLTRVSQDQQQALFEFKGSFQDGTGIPGQFTVQYLFDFQQGTVTEKVMENTRDKVREVNSKLHNLVMLKYPLEVGHSWQQEVVFAGEKKIMTGQIVGNAYEGRTFYSRQKQFRPVMTVRYTVEHVPGYYHNTYVEERRFQPGWGLIGYSHLMPGDLGLTDKTDDYHIEEAIINHMFGYGLNRE